MHGPDTSVALAAVAAGIDDAETVLEDLVDASLLRPDAPGRYSFHDLIRDYARERLHSDEPDVETHRLRTRDWLLDTATRSASAFVPGDQGASDLAGADRWLSDERVNWRGAFREAVADGAHERVLALAKAMHWYSDHRGTGELWLEVYTAGVAAAGALGEWEKQAQQLNFVVWVYVARHTNLPQAKRWHRQALRVAQRCGSLAETAWSHYYRAAIESRDGDPAAGVVHARRAAELFREAHEPMNVVLTMSYLGVLQQRQGRFDEAVETHRACVEQERALRGSDRGVALENAAQLVLRLADALAGAGEHDEALNVVAEAEELLGRGSANLLSMAGHTRGRALVAAGRLAEARNQLAGAVESLSDPETKVAVLIEIAGLCDRVGDHDAAVRHRVRALAESEGYESPGMARLQHDLAEVLGLSA
ncbi:hypothetical protein GCM10011609_83830 [Lentzea pudingi]|uniref:Tetratricopeptide repeat protein n=1 Tax=Lentzea pudingi TaxID=1789439 RepID=A0ABQ2IUL8_9PSEU|nr:hypothetical protein [Lentzea pudingi]GGN28039.1 hypothetical protein GCM10011609_83830 [Lentzea pudingi]